jgi:hypothetical protein
MTLVREVLEGALALVGFGLHASLVLLALAWFAIENTEFVVSLWLIKHGHGIATR